MSPCRSCSTMRMRSARSKLLRTETLLMTFSVVSPVVEVYCWKELVSLCSWAEICVLTCALARSSASPGVAVEMPTPVMKRERGNFG